MVVFIIHNILYAGLRIHKTDIFDHTNFYKRNFTKEAK